MSEVITHTLHAPRSDLLTLCDPVMRERRGIDRWELEVYSRVVLLAPLPVALRLASVGVNDEVDHTRRATVLRHLHAPTRLSLINDLWIIPDD